MSTLSPRNAVPSGSCRRRAATSCPGTSRPFAATTRCHGTADRAIPARQRFYGYSKPGFQRDLWLVMNKDFGVVDGMAYSLYSDGSIEAQMPEGMMRFASIDELRAHLDQRP